MLLALSAGAYDGPRPIVSFLTAFCLDKIPHFAHTKLRKGVKTMTTAFFRTIILYIVLMTGLRLMGKRQIGELEPSELVLTLIIADLAAVPMQDYGIPLVNGLLPIVVMLCLSMILSFFNLKSIRFRALLCGRPAIIVQRGKIIQQAMAKNRFTIDELLEQLRSQGITDLADVKYAVLETSGKLSILPWPDKSPLTPAAAQMSVEDTLTLPILLINDGRLMAEHLHRCGRDKAWLDKVLHQHGLSSPTQVFLLSVDESGNILCIPKEEQP